MKYIVTLLVVFAMLSGCKPGVLYKTNYKVPGIGDNIPGARITHFNILDHVLSDEELVCYEAEEKAWIEMNLKFTVDTLWVEYIEDNPGFTGTATKFRCQ